MNEAQLSKAAMRQQQRQRRRDLSLQQREAFDRSIRQHLAHLIRSQKALAVAAYLPFDGEPDLKPLCQQLLSDGVSMALPVISAPAGHAMTFNAWRLTSKLQRSSFGIPEPVATAVMPPSELDMLLIPLVAYDLDGNRLGMGAGYYDRHLQALRDLPTPLRVGVAYSLQQVSRISLQQWDIPLHGVVNENGWLAFTT